MSNYAKQKEYFNSKAKNWDNIAIHDVNKISHILKDLNIKTNCKVLDVGTGTGILIPHIINILGENGNIVAVDFAKNMIEIAKERHKYLNVEFINGDIYELDFEKNSFDYIICYSVFPHFEDKNAIIEKLCTLLKANGKLLIAHSQSREQINNLHSSLEDTVNKDSLPEMKSIIEMLKNTGLKIETSVDSSEMFYVVGTK